MTIEPYGVLGLPRNADYDEVRRAYRCLAGGSGAAIVPRSAAVPDITFPMSPPPSPPLLVDLLETLMPVSAGAAAEAYLRLLRLPPPRLVDVCG